MTQTSYPVAEAPFTDIQYAAVFESAIDGVIDDWTSPYGITINTNDTVTVKPGTNGRSRAILNGYVHEINANENLSVPAVTSQTRYNIGLLYDNTNALPVRLAVLKGVTPTLTGTQSFMPLMTIDRASGQALTAATAVLIRPRRAETIAVDGSAALNALNPLFFLKGTLALDLQTGAIYRADGNATAARWVAIARENEIASFPQGANVTTVRAKTTTIFRGTITVAVETVAQLQFTGQAVNGAVDANWAGTLQVLVDGNILGSGRRYGTSSGKGSVPLSLDRTVRARLSAGSHAITATMFIESGSGAVPTITNPDIEVWAQ